MKVIYMQPTIDNFINKGRIHQLVGDPKIVELTDDKGNIKNKYYIFEK